MHEALREVILHHERGDRVRTFIRIAAKIRIEAAKPRRLPEGQHEKHDEQHEPPQVGQWSRRRHGLGYRRC